jgi:site-specific DNA-adenine methylase
MQWFESLFNFAGGKTDKENDSIAELGPEDKSAGQRLFVGGQSLTILLGTIINKAI